MSSELFLRLQLVKLRLRHCTASEADNRCSTDARASQPGLVSHRHELVEHQDALRQSLIAENSSMNIRLMKLPKQHSSQDD